MQLLVLLGIGLGLENVSYNINRKNQDLKFYEFGKTYHKIKAIKFKDAFVNVP